MSGINIRYDIYVDGVPALNAEPHLTFTANTTEYVIMEAIIPNMPIGAHTVEIYATVNSGSATGVAVDPVGWGGTILVSEHF